MDVKQACRVISYRMYYDTILKVWNTVKASNFSPEENFAYFLARSVSPLGEFGLKKINKWRQVCRCRLFHELPFFWFSCRIHLMQASLFEREFKRFHALHSYGLCQYIQLWHILHARRLHRRTSTVLGISESGEYPVCSIFLDKFARKAYVTFVP